MTSGISRAVKVGFKKPVFRFRKPVKNLKKSEFLVFLVF